MSAAVDVRVFIEVNEIDQQLDTDYTDEARRVPDDVTSGPTGEHRQLALLHSFTALNIRHHHHHHHHHHYHQQQQQQHLRSANRNSTYGCRRSTTPAQQSAELAAR